MTRTHVPVLAGELIEALDPQPGQVAVDCTVGGGRPRPPRRRARSARPAADRHRPRPARRGALRRAGRRGRVRDALHPRRLRRRPRAAARRGRRAPTSSTSTSGMSSMQVDTRERGFSYAYDAPLDMRMDPAQELTAADVVNTWDERRLARIAARVRRGALRRAGSPAAIVRRRARGRSTPPSSSSTSITAAIPAPARFAGGHPPSAPSRPSASPSTTSSTQLDAALPLAWELLARTAGSAAISFHSLEDRRVKRFLADRARGCICPPDLPVCACGRTPEAELFTAARSSPTPGRDRRTTRARSPPACAPPASSRRPLMPRAATAAARHAARGPATARAGRTAPRRSPARRAKPRARLPAPPRRSVRPASFERIAPRSPTTASSTASLRGAPGSAARRRCSSGIVAMQVSLLKLNSGICRAVERPATLERQNADAGGEHLARSSRASASARRPTRSAWSSPPPAQRALPARPRPTATRAAPRAAMRAAERATRQALANARPAAPARRCAAAAADAPPATDGRRADDRRGHDDRHRDAAGHGCDAVATATRRTGGDPDHDGPRRPRAGRPDHDSPTGGRRVGGASRGG